MGYQYAIALFEGSNGISQSPIIARSTSPADRVSHIEYYTSDGIKLASFILNQNDHSIELNYRISRSSSRTLCVTGDEMIDCIESVYTENGWWSVGAWVATAFAPEVALIVLGGCGLYECNN